MSKDIDSLEINRILIIDLAFIGDVILATPVTRAVRSRWPEAHITMLTVPLTQSVAEMNPYVDQVMTYDKRGAHKGIKGMWRMSRELKQQGFDLAICMNFAVRGAVVSWLAGIPYRLGYDAQHGSWFLTWAASHIRQGLKHETLNHLEVLEPFGLTTEDTSLCLKPPISAKESFREKLSQWNLPQRNYYVLCPFGSYQRKNMPEEMVAELVSSLSAEHPVYLIGGPQERLQLEAYAQAAKLDPGNVLAGSLNLQELAVLLKNALKLYTVDTGPMHMAQAVECPTVAIFGPTDPAVWGPKNSNSRDIYTHEACSPCWGKGECEDNVCIKKISSRDML